MWRTVPLLTRLGAVDGLVPWMDVRCRMLVMVFFAAYSAGPDMGPTFGADYGGDDYNVTSWNTPKSKAADNYKASALACEAYCDADPKCCAWTYCPPGSGEEEVEPFAISKIDGWADAPMNDAALGERCCLKSHVPRELKGAKHWTGLPARAVKDGKITKQCQGPPPPPPPPPTDPGCRTWDGKCVAAYPGNDWQHPKIHQSPDCLHLGGWHDMAGALTFDGVNGLEHHAFQGCPGSQGWSHSASTDLVHWEDRGRHVHMIHETYEGMDSTSCGPCSGFVSVDDEGTPCAGFRQCGSTKGVTGLNPAAHKWDVPMEVRCAENLNTTGSNLTEWSDPIWIYQAYFYRGLPYDPVRPWKDTDGKWYSAWSTDGCNGTNQWGPTPASNLKKTPCKPGGQLELLVSDALHGPKANWKQLPPMFTTNVTKSGMQTHAGAITREFVTSGYFGGLAGDPDGGKTRVVTQNNAGPTYWVGKQEPGGQFNAYWDKVGAVGHYDYGSLTMARTLGSDPNQVAKNGRRVLLGWIGGGSPASQSLARDLTLSSEYELLQAFVPELQMLRQPASFEATTVDRDDEEDSVPHSKGSLQLEVVATFSWTTTPAAPFGVSVLGGSSKMTIDCAGTDPSAPKGCMVGVDGKMGPLMPIGTKSVTLHSIVDHEIIESIYNNRTAMVTYNKKIPSATSTEVMLWGTGAGIKANLQTWSLDAANNLGPQP